MKMLSSMIMLATEAHDGQFDKGGRPYILHSLTVMHKLRTEDDIFDLQRAEACLREAMTSLCLDWMSPEDSILR